mmetsp:Transcript_5942/g.5365  ORF Transcript_5942/g.5365 Transcript_5942/m.5365 type:complete len:91 (-) Transcript_5942:1276-1548(-)
MQTNNIYSTKRGGTGCSTQREVKDETYRPNINPLSEKIAQNLEARQGKTIQQRLYEHHKKQINMKKSVEEKALKEAKENAKPKILKQKKD